MRVRRLARMPGAVTMLIFLACAPVPRKSYVCDPGSRLTDSSLTILYVPLCNVTIDYQDNTELVADTQFTDTFFLEAGEGLLRFEVDKRFSMHKHDETLRDIAQFFPGQRVLDSVS